MFQTFAYQKALTKEQLIPLIRQILADEEPSLEHLPSSTGEPGKKQMPALFKEFLDERYDGGKAKVPNPNFETRKQWPEVSLNHAVRFEMGGKKPVWEKLLVEYAAWKKDRIQKQSPIHPSSMTPAPTPEQIQKSLAEVKTWTEDQKAKKFWDLPTSKEPPVPGDLATPTPGKKLAVGSVIFNEKGQILLREPTDHFGDYVWTFPKGKQSKTKKETLAETALREVQEETGWETELQSVIPKNFGGDTSTNVFYLAKGRNNTGKHDRETQNLKWVSFDEAPKYIKQTPNPSGQKRDLAILEAAKEQRDLALAQHHAQTTKPEVAPPKKEKPAKAPGAKVTLDLDITAQDKDSGAITVPKGSEIEFVRVREGDTSKYRFLYKGRKIDVPATVADNFFKSTQPEVLKSESSKPESTKAAPSADTILHEKISGQKGSNPGGFYKGSDSVKRYVKFYPDPSQAESENLTNQIYDQIGVKAPESLTFQKNGKSAFASTVIKDLETFGDKGIGLYGEPDNKEEAKKLCHEAMKGYAADVLTANWDAPGQDFDNLTYSKEKGGVVRIDQGGSLLFRAMGGRKIDKFPDFIGTDDWDSIIQNNKRYRLIMKTAGFDKPDDMAEIAIPVIDKIEELSKKPGGWKKMIEEHSPGLSENDKKQTLKLLDTRTALLIKKREQLKKNQGKKASLKFLIRSLI